MIIVQDDEKELEKVIKMEGGGEEVGALIEHNPQMSLHALEGTYNYETMILKRFVGKRVLCILINSSSTLNFIDTIVIVKLGFAMESIIELKMLVVNENELRINETCKEFSWTMQGQNFQAEASALPLENYDLVLGIQWLVELDDIVQNFKKLHMKFQVKNKEYMLQGDQVHVYSLVAVSSGKLNKVLSKIAQVVMVQCFNLRVECFTS